MMSKEELQGRVGKLQRIMGEHQCDAVLIFQNVDLYYFSGTMQSAYLYIPLVGDPVLFCRKSITRAQRECPWRIIQIPNIKVIPQELTSLNLPVPDRLALEFDVLPVTTYVLCQKIFSGAELVDGSGWIKSVRSIKSPYEISLLKNAGIKMAEVFKQIPSIIKVGQSEMACASEVEKIARLTRHEGIIRLRGYNQELFFGHFLSGFSGAEFSFNDGATAGTGLGPFFPQGCSEKKLRENEPISLDYVGIYNGYQIDMTRIFVIGSLPADLNHAFEIALAIQAAIIVQTRPGVLPSNLWDTALDIAQKAGLQEYFMGFGSDQAKFVGHGIGLEVDELPVLARGFNTPLEEGMVFALEPKFVFPGRGMVGIENTWQVTEDGAEKISVFPDELVVI